MNNKVTPRGEFSKNVLTLMTGTSVAQAIPIAISPILTRIYTPEDFGVFALFVAVASIFGSIANARYELAIMLPKKEEDAINIFALGLIIVSIVSLTLLVLVFMFGTYFASFLNNREIEFWLYFVPLAVFLTGLFNLLNYFNNRKKRYKDMANAVIMKSIVLAVLQLLIGFFKSGATGLVSGQLISNLTANTKLLKNIFEDKVLISKINTVKIIALARRYKDFPKYSMWAVLANTMAQYLVNILISVLYAIATLGFYSLVQRVLAMPSALIGNSVGQVFFQQATKEKQLTGKAIHTFNATIKKLFIIAVPFFGILYFMVEDLFAFVFGKEWILAGEYAQIVMLFFAARFISSPLAIITTVYEKQKQSLIINLILIVTSMGLLYLASIVNMGFKDFLLWYSAAMSVNYSLFLIYYYKLAKGK